MEEKKTLVPLSEFASGTLRARVCRGEYLWTIEGFSHLNPSKDVDSEEFTLCGHRWKLDLCPAAFDGETTGKVAVFLWNRDAKSILVQFRIELLDRNDVPLAEYVPAQLCHFVVRGKQSATEHMFSNFGTSSLAQYADVLESKNGYLVNDTLRIRCTIEHAQQIRAQVNALPAVISHHTLCHDLGKLLDSGKHR